jgi:hypothetical protein
MSAALEKRIASALADDAPPPSADLASLIRETEAAITAADESADGERARALDPLLSPDSVKARQSLDDFTFAAARLRTVLPRMRKRCAELEAAEHRARWEPDYEQVRARRDEMMTEFAERYQSLTQQLVDLFGRVAAVDEEVSRVSGSAPYGEHRRLRGVEATAHGGTAIAPAVRLPSFEKSALMSWPIPVETMGQRLAREMERQRTARESAVDVDAPPPRPRREWWEKIEERTRANAEARARNIEHLNGLAQDREKRENAEMRARAEARSAWPAMRTP